VSHPDTIGAPLVVIAVAMGYEWLGIRATVRGRRWSSWRTASFLTGCLLLVVALAPAGHGDFVDHMARHLLVGMLAPLALVLGAPVTLVLRTVSPAAGRAVGRLLHTRTLRVVAHPVTALCLNVGGLALLYVTPLYTRTLADPSLHRAVQVHFLAAGYLFAWVVAGPDPAPRRPSVPARLVVLGAAVAAHAVLAQLLYAGALVHIPATIEQRQGGATLMYYGGDIAELLIAFALVSSWRPRRPASGRSAATTGGQGLTGR
jgi:putative membrane protein